MGKKKGFDVIADAHERANHNFHSVYWFNRVTSFTLAEWKANKYFAPLFFVIYTTVGLLWLNSLHQTAFAADKTFWSFLFDFSDSSTIALFTGVLLFSVYWVILMVATVQVVVQRIFSSPPVSQPERKREKKKKYPKRPKNWE